MKGKLLLVAIVVALCLVGCGGDIDNVLTAQQVDEQLTAIKDSGVLKMSEEPFWYHIYFAVNNNSGSQFRGFDVVKLEDGYYFSKDLRKYSKLSTENANALYTLLQKHDIFTLGQSEESIAGGMLFEVFCEYSDGTMQQNTSEFEAIQDEYEFLTGLKTYVGFE